MSQVGAWDFAEEKLHALRQRAAAGRADAGKSSRTLAPLYVAAGGKVGGLALGPIERKVFCCRKALLLPLRDFSCGRGKVSAAQALLPWG